MSSLSASFVPILAVMSGEAEQMETEQRSVQEMEASLIALLAGEEFAWIRPEAKSNISNTEQKSNKSAVSYSGVGGPGPESEESENSTENGDVASSSSSDQPPAAPEQLEMDFDGLDADEALLDGRRRPGVPKELPERVTQNNPGAISAPPPEAFPTDEFPVPDRWRIMQSLCPAKGGDESIYTLFGALRNNCHSTLNPYN